MRSLKLSGVDYEWFWRGLSKFENFNLKWDLNTRHLDWYSAALPIELFNGKKYQDLNSSVGRAAEYQSKGRVFKPHFRLKFSNFDKPLQNQS